MCRFNSYKANYRHSTVYIDTGNYIMDKHNIKSRTNYTQALEEKSHYYRKSKNQTKMKRGKKSMITKNYITQNIRIMNKCY
jgi:hypothetical protein